MKLYMMLKYNEDGGVEKRSSGTEYIKWTKQGKCWSGASFKSSLTYFNYTPLRHILKIPNKLTVLEIDIDNQTFTEIEFKEWCTKNLKGFKEISSDFGY